MPHKITIVNIRRADSNDINHELQWLGTALGLFNLRDKDSSCFRVFITLVRTARQNKLLTSDEIADRLHLSRGTVVHHLSRLIDAGMVIHEHKGYILREGNLQSLINDIHRDVEGTFSQLLKVAQEIDEMLG